MCRTKSCWPRGRTCRITKTNWPRQLCPTLEVQVHLVLSHANCQVTHFDESLAQTSATVKVQQHVLQVGSLLQEPDPIQVVVVCFQVGWRPAKIYPDSSTAKCTEKHLLMNWCCDVLSDYLLAPEAVTLPCQSSPLPWLCQWVWGFWCEPNRKYKKKYLSQIKPLFIYHLDPSGDVQTRFWKILWFLKATQSANLYI